MCIMICRSGEVISCPVPTSDGRLVSIALVYDSWLRKDWQYTTPTEYVPFTRLPCFKLSQESGLASLACPEQIDLVYNLLQHLELYNDPIISIQISETSAGEAPQWKPISFADTIKVVCALCYAKSTGASQGWPVFVNKDRWMVTFHITGNDGPRFDVTACSPQPDDTPMYRCRVKFNHDFAVKFHGQTSFSN